MRRIFTYFKDHFFPTPQPSISPEELQSSFTRRYRHFRSLLTGNNKTLQAMAELEKLYYSGESYRMAEVRSKILTILINVYKMIGNLIEMSDGKYRQLENVYEKIKNDIDAIVVRQPPHRPGEFFIPLDQISRKDRDLTGDKMATLGELSRLKTLNIPPGFVLTAAATRHFLTTDFLAEVNRRMQILDADDLQGLYKTCTELQQMIIDTPLPPDLKELLYHHYSYLEKATHTDCRVAFRSSAFGEDSVGISFAGLYSTILDVKKENLGEAYKKIIASKYGPKAIAYRRSRGFRHEDIEMCVGCLVMIDSVIGGVSYSSYPWREGKKTVRINAAGGIAKGVVDGTAASDLFLVDRESPHSVLHSELRQEQHKLADRNTDRSILTPMQIEELTKTALLLEGYFGRPQDIEWSYDQHGKLYTLQSRPLRETSYNSDNNGKIEPQQSTPLVGDPPIIEGGICASEGISFGKVFKVTSRDDINNCPAKAVLVMDYPLPDWAPLLNRAAAVLAQHGTEAGHLATVSREFGVPALFSLPEIMNTLVNGQMITVYATEGKVFEGCREDLLSIIQPKQDIMAGSPVQRILADALQHITPLNLNDPSSHHFKISWCETLHDITRYCHEKSVSEMFNFGDRLNFDKGKAKRLVAHIPLEWWVINLADGFREDTDDTNKAIHIDDIVSIPMLAIWKGLSAYPWGGPPPISAKGFGSIIFQSAMRPDLDPSVASRLTAKNYFLVSKHFCNLNVRLGYHYAMIESYISDFLSESYITFRFKGGAADLHRKTMRARLLADILEKFDFDIELQSDALLARIKRRSRDYLEQRLQILGYLTLHTRQIDMVMDRNDTVRLYREKFLRNIDEMLNSTTNSSGEQI
jgi:pyruvate, water dikinase